MIFTIVTVPPRHWFHPEEPEKPRPPPSEASHWAHFFNRLGLFAAGLQKDVCLRREGSNNAKDRTNHGRPPGMVDASRNLSKNIRDSSRPSDFKRATAASTMTGGPHK